MSLTVFLAFWVLGCDFLIFVLFKWLYGEKRREPSSRSALGKHALPSQSPLYYVSAKVGRRAVRPLPSPQPDLARAWLARKAFAALVAMNARPTMRLTASWPGVPSRSS